MDEDRHNKVLMRYPGVLNKQASNVQVTSEQLLIDAQLYIGKETSIPQQKIQDEDELNDYKFKKRKQFEEKVQKQKFKISEWVRYAQWEEQLQEFRRARSLYERAIDIDYTHITLWLKYAEMEMKHKFINHARNVWERACTYLPRVDHFWYKYAYMEEMLGNYNRARQVFEKWMTWKPEEKAWLSYIKFEQRMGEHEKCREIMYRYLDAFPRLKTYLKVAKFEQKNKNKEYSRKIYEKAVEDLGEEALTEEYFLEFVKFETKNKEYDRVREIFKFGLDQLNRDNSQKLQEQFITFEKQFGSKEEIDIVILNKRRIKYKSILEKNPLIYDTWFDLIHLEQATSNKEKVREAYEQAVKNLPPSQEKRLWRRYIYLWYSYAIFEEIDCNDPLKAQQVFERVLQIVPHKEFTFSKLWIFAAHLQLRCLNLEQARKIFGLAIGKCPTQKILKAYIEMELQLANIDRCRTLHEKYIEIFPQLCNSWIAYAELEQSLNEDERVRAIFELGIASQNLDMPETVWKAYIDYEINLAEYEKADNLFKRLLEKSKHVKVWISYAQFQASINNKDETRKILQDAENYLKENSELSEDRVLLLENWKEIEEKFGDQEFIDSIIKKQPKKVKKQRKIKIQDGSIEEDAGWEEYFEYMFPDDSKQQRNLSILQKAHLWKKQKQ